MAGFSQYLKGKFVAHVFKATAYSAGATIAAALHTSDPTAAGNNTEVTNANGYARVTSGLAPSSNPSTNWEVDGADSGRVWAISDVTFPTCVSSGWGTITHGSLWDNGSHNTGNMLFYGALSASKVIGVGDVFKFLGGGDLEVALS